MLPGIYKYLSVLNYDINEGRADMSAGLSNTKNSDGVIDLVGFFSNDDLIPNQLEKSKCGVFGTGLVDVEVDTVHNKFSVYVDGKVNRIFESFSRSWDLWREIIDFNSMHDFTN